MKLKLELERDTILNKIKLYGLDRKIQFERVCKGLELYDLIMTSLIKTAGFDVKLKTDANKLKDDPLFLHVDKYPKNIKLSLDEFGFDIKSGKRILIKLKKTKPMRLCRKHQVEYPLAPSLRLARSR